MGETTELKTTEASQAHSAERDNFFCLTSVFLQTAAKEETSPNPY